MKTAFSLLFFLVSIASAQLPTTDLQSISPRVAKAGKTIEVTVAGVNLEDPTALHFSDSRIQAKPVLKPAEDLVPDPPAIPNRFEITVPADVPPAIYEVRTVGRFGLSTPRPFMVVAADSIEVTEDGDHSTRDTAAELPIGTALIGRIDSKAIDWYRFTAKKDQQLLIRLWAERLDSKMNGQLRIYDSSGREIDHGRPTFGRDPLADFAAPADGDYFLALSDVLYRGDANHFYRLQISETPHIDFVFPPAGEPGKKSKFTVFGRSLPGGSLDSGLMIDGKPLESIEVEIDIPAEAQAPVEFSSLKPTQAALRGIDYKLADSNAVRIGFATAPVIVEEKDAANQTVALPCEIAGRFDEIRDFDTFSFKGSKDKTYWIEVISDQLRAPTDPTIFVEKLGGEEITKVAENDQRTTYFSVDNLDATNVDSSDCALSFTADEDADFQVTIVNHFGGGGPDQLYRLAIREAKPDFDLYALYERPLADGRNGWPSTPVLRKNGSIAIRIVAPRRDGFDGEITVTAEDLPQGITAYPLVMNKKTDQGFLVFSATADAETWAGPIQITGKAAQLTRQARSTSLVWGIVFADAFRVRTKLDLETVLSVSGEDNSPSKLEPTEDKPLTVEIGAKLEIPIKVEDFGERKGNLTVQPEGLFGMLRSPPTVNIAADATEGMLVIDFTKNGNYELEPGVYQFTLQGTGVVSFAHNPEAAERATAESKRLEELTPQVSTELSQAKIAATTAKTALDTAQRNVAAVAEDKKQEMETVAAAAQAKFDETTKATAAAEAKLKRLEQLKTEAEKITKAAQDKAQPKDTKFAIYSKPLTVTVTPKAEEAK
ncbi:MAG: hypothetical protein ACI8UO_000591 [Verrucomicrobiales bacterium]|jgi:hypothetical protein